MAALGLSRVDESDQRAALGGTAADLARSCLSAARRDADPGAVALALWAAAEVAGATDPTLVRILTTRLETQVDTVVVAWSLVAAIAVGSDATALRDVAANRLLECQGADGIFPHQIPRGRGVRSHIGSFADQIYPTQAFARLARATGDRDWLAVANRTARRLVDLQGDHGQWWWHYDHRDGSVVERFPVYSVHQHAMAPMVLFELIEAGGDDHRSAIGAGVRWLTTHPECVEPLIVPELGVVWRKVGRHEPCKLSRAIGAASTAIRPRLQIPGVDRFLTPGKVDYECRPYELGWLLYAWAAATKDAR
jgi:hypothetical protein